MCKEKSLEYFVTCYVVKLHEPETDLETDLVSNKSQHLKVYSQTHIENAQYIKVVKFLYMYGTCNKI